MIRTVMLVDDEPDIRKIGELSLKHVGGWEVQLVGWGAEAIVLAAAAPPDVILLDVMMPEMDGPTTLVRLREQAATAAIPVIFMTAKVQKYEVDRYRELGAAGVIGKPFDPMTLAADVRRILEGQGQTRE